MTADAPSSARQGLAPAEVLRRRESDGYNELPAAGRRGVARIIRDVLREPMLAMLLAGGGVYLALGDTAEAVVLLVFASFSVVISVVQESRTERVMESLRDLTSPRALVIRGGQQCRIPGREVVRGDIVLLHEGDRVPADAIVREAGDFHLDESLLTGESVPVRKRCAADTETPAGRPGGDDLPTIFSGTLVVRGHAVAEVSATGGRSEIGKIGLALEGLETEAPKLRRQLQGMVRVFGAAGAAISLGVVLLYGFLRGGWLDAILAGIAIGMAMLPEEFPVVLTVFMAMGAWRISRARVLTRRAAAIEALGAATVLCTDKTGTLTLNKMSVAELRLPGGKGPDGAAAPDTAARAALVRAGVLASAPDPHDPMERALHAWRGPGAAAAPEASAGLTLVREYALSQSLLAMSNVWRRGDGALMVAAKGAPEAIAGLCRLDDAAEKQIRALTEEMGDRGIRVLGVAEATFAGNDLPASQRGFDFSYLGLVGFADPLREDVPAAVAACRAAGVRVIMVTGDYPATASAIARSAGLGVGTALTGDDLRRMTDEQLAEAVKSVTVFARIMPEQKLRIVEALKANGEVVAMTGDGVNDAPSLKAAHIGIAMGGRGTDVAREAAALVLLDDDFRAIVGAIALGRRIHDNIRKALGFIFAVHVPLAGLAVMPLLLGFPLLLGPAHIALLEMLIDPACTLVFEAEPEEANVMARPPRRPTEPLFPRAMILWALGQGLLVFVLVAALFAALKTWGFPEGEVRALTMIALVAGVVSLILVNRSARPRPGRRGARPPLALSVILAGIPCVLGAVLAVPALRHLFGFSQPAAAGFALAAATAGATLILLMLGKAAWMRGSRAAV